MSIATHAFFVLAIAALCASCGDAIPSPSVAPASPSPTTKAETPTPTTRPAGSPSAPSISPDPTAPTPTPPYDIEYDDEAPQEAGTVWFGNLTGAPSSVRLEPVLQWPKGGLTYEGLRAFGAFWGEPIGVSRIRISLYQVSGGTLDLIWSDLKRIEPDATGYLDDLVPFKGPGTYRLEVTRGLELLAWGVAHLGPRCEVNCSGG